MPFLETGKFPPNTTKWVAQPRIVDILSVYSINTSMNLFCVEHYIEFSIDRQEALHKVDRANGGIRRDMQGKPK